MAADSASIANLALSHLGVYGKITNLTTDQTTEGKACRMFYARSVSETLRQAPWQCAKKQVALTLIGTNADGTGLSGMAEWEYSYRLPEDCVMPLRILYAGNRNPNAQQEIPFALFADATSTDYDAATTYAAGDYARSVSIWYRALRTTIGDTPASSTSDWVAVTAPPKILRTDVQYAVLEYTYDLTDTTRFDVDFESAVACLLAYYIAPNITVNGSMVDLRGQVAATYDLLVGQAKMNDYNARKRDLPPKSGYQTVRITGVRQ